MFIREVNKKLGEILIEQGKISREQLEKALKEQTNSKLDQKKIGNCLIDLGYITEEDAVKALGLQFNLPVMHIKGLRIKPGVLDLIPENLAKKFNIIPLFKIEKELTLALSDPTDLHLLDIVSSETRCTVIPVLAPYSEISKTIEKHYSQKIETQISVSKEESETAGISRSEIEQLRKAGGELPIVKTVDRILVEAVENSVSDIHIEPRGEKLNIRFRIDGILQEFTTYPGKMHPGIVSRIKILSCLDISEKQKPQDGRVQIKIDNKEIDIRVSTLPTSYGEKVVMRLLHRESVSVKIDVLGFSENNLNSFYKFIREPYGIILVTGPTGSGKTTTLYAALNEINSIEKNIITVEDPVEYQLPIINQVQVNIKKNLTFANILRSILRQDPDVIMIGEIRDPETAAIAAESALTGHLVFSTLHTNDAPSSIIRLMDMGVAPFLLAPSLLGIIAQRLARKICVHCKEKYIPSKEEMGSVGLYTPIKELVFYRGAGCDNCGNTGYKGRMGIHEILVVDEDIKELITKNESVSMIRQKAVQKGFKDMRFDGLKKVISGMISIEELLRVTKNIN